MVQVNIKDATLLSEMMHILFAIFKFQSKASYWCSIKPVLPIKVIKCLLEGFGINFCNSRHKYAILMHHFIL